MCTSTERHALILAVILILIGIVGGVAHADNELWLNGASYHYKRHNKWGDRYNEVNLGAQLSLEIAQLEDGTSLNLEVGGYKNSFNGWTNYIALRSPIWESTDRRQEVGLMIGIVWGYKFTDGATYEDGAKRQIIGVIPYFRWGPVRFLADPKAAAVQFRLIQW